MKTYTRNSELIFLGEFNSELKHWRGTMILRRFQGWSSQTDFKKHFWISLQILLWWNFLPNFPLQASSSKKKQTLVRQTFSWQTVSASALRMRSPEPSSPSTAEALLHGQFASWGTGSNSNNNSCPNSPGGPVGLSPAASPTPAPASNYALTLTHTHIHIQRLSPRPGKEARLLLPLSELVGCSCPRAPAPPLLVLYWYPPGKRRKGVSRRRQVRAYLAESRAEAERWSAAVQCLLRDVTVTADTGECVSLEAGLSMMSACCKMVLHANICSWQWSSGTCD